MKGGESLNFRHVLITGLMVGAFFLLSENAFAERNETNGQQNAQIYSVQADPSVNTDNTAIQTDVQPKNDDKVIQTNLPETADHTAFQTNPPAKVEEVEIPAKTRELHEAVGKNQGEVEPQKKAYPNPATLGNLSNQAKDSVQTALKKTEQSVKAPREGKVATKLENNRLDKNELTQKNSSRNSVLEFFHINDFKVKNVSQLPGSFKKFDLQKANLNLLISNKKRNSDLFLPKPLEKDKDPSKKGILTVSQSSNLTQRTNSPGGQSNDRVSNGLSTLSLIDKWVEWNKFNGIELVHHYFSRQVLMNNQWVNAPPSPPPLEAPLLKTVSFS